MASCSLASWAVGACNCRLPEGLGTHLSLALAYWDYLEKSKRMEFCQDRCRGPFERLEVPAWHFVEAFAGLEDAGAAAFAVAGKAGWEAEDGKVVDSGANKRIGFRW